MAYSVNAGQISGRERIQFPAVFPANAVAVFKIKPRVVGGLIVSYLVMGPSHGYANLPVAIGLIPDYGFGCPRDVETRSQAPAARVTLYQITLAVNTNRYNASGTFVSKIQIALAASADSLLIARQLVGHDSVTDPTDGDADCGVRAGHTDQLRFVDVT
jgi:hypothetical protein